MKNLVLFLVSLHCFIISGCGAKYPFVEGQTKVAPNVINIGKDGLQRSMHGNTIHPHPEQFEYIFSGIEKFIDGESDSIEQSSGTKHILIYIHGGLNSHKDAMIRVVDSIREMKNTNTYPVFINWRSDPFTTLGDHYFRIRYGKVETDAALVSPIYMLGDVAKTIGNAPMAWYHESAQVAKTTFLDHDDKHLEGDISREVVSVTADDAERWNFWRRAIWMVTAPFKIITTPFMFTLGKPAWDNMKRRTHTMFVCEKDFRDPQLSEADSPLPNGTVLRFLGELNEYIQTKRDKGVTLELTLMGHSMGGIVINRALRDLPDLDVDNLVYMASADNLQNYLDATLALMKRRKALGKSINIYNLHLHPENENREISFYGLLPSGSLLAWIDSSFDTPEFIMQRTSGRWSNIRQVINFIPQEFRGNYHFKVFGRGPSRQSPQTHGAFDEIEFRFWQKSYWIGTDVF